MALKQPPGSHPKNPVTGLGQVARTPGNATTPPPGPSKHIPKTGK